MDGPGLQQALTSRISCMAPTGSLPVPTSCSAPTMLRTCSNCWHVFLSLSPHAVDPPTHDGGQTTSYHVVEEGLRADVHVEQLAVAATRVQQVCSKCLGERLWWWCVIRHMPYVCVCGSDAAFMSRRGSAHYSADGAASCERTRLHPPDADLVDRLDGAPAPPCCENELKSHAVTSNL